MAGKSKAPDQCILRRSAFRVFRHRLAALLRLERHTEIHEIIIEKPGFDAEVGGRRGCTGRPAQGLRGLGAAGAGGQRQKAKRRRLLKHLPRYSAAIAVVARALALAESSAITSEARAMGLVR